MTLLPCLLNRSLTITDGWMHVCPLGEFPWRRYDDDGNLVEEIIQVIDNVACVAMAASYPLSVQDSMIDWEHKSMGNTDDTDAAGWGKEAQVREDGLWVRVEWSDKGQEAVTGKRYKFNSPVFAREGMQVIQGNRQRPTKLGRIALTNNPNLSGQTPLTNRRDPANPNPNPNTMELKTTLLTLLRLAATATDQEIVDAVTSLKSAGTEMEAMGNRVSELETQIANADLDGHGITDVAQRAMFTPLLTNSTTRQAALTTLGTLKGKATTPIHNRSGTPTKPEALQNAETTEAKDKAQAQAGWISNRARDIASKEKIAFSAAFARASAEWENRSSAN